MSERKANDEMEIVQIEIEVLSWEKFNPKRDQQTYTWLRLNNDLPTDPDLFGLTGEQKYVWITILCQASKKNHGKLSINVDQLAYITQVKVDAIRQLIVFLENKGMIVVHDRALPQATAARPHTTPTNETNETNERKNNAQSTEPKPSESEQSESNALAQPDGFADCYADFYAGYPRKVGKTKGAKVHRQLIRTGVDPKDLLVARDNYRKYCEKNGIAEKFVKHPATFLNEYLDWLDPETGNCDLKSQPQPDADSFLNDAKRVMTALKSVSPVSSTSSEQLTTLLGPELFKRAYSVEGGTPAIRQMKADDFSLRRLAGMLKDAAEKINSKSKAEVQV